MLLSNRIFDLFEDMFDDPFLTRPFFDNGVQMMKTDVQEMDQHYMVDLELPGYTKEDVKAELKNGYLTITANKEDSKEDKDSNGNYIKRERYTGTCKRSFYVGENVRQEDIQAGFKDGILRLVIPKEEPKKIEDQPKLITIQ